MSLLKKLFAKKETHKRKPDVRATEDILFDDLLPRWKKAFAQQDAGQLDAAMTSYLDIIRDFPTALSAHNNLAVIYNQKEQYSKALDQLKRALHDFYPISQVTMGLTYHGLGLLDEAVAAFEKAVSSPNPTAKSAYSNLGAMYCERGDYEAAIATGKKAVDQDPNDPIAWGNLFRAYRKADLWGEAEALVEKASRLVDVNSIRPGIQQNCDSLLAVFYPESQTLLLVDPRTRDILGFKENK